MARKILGELFGIQIVYPFERENIREAVKNRVHLMKSRAEQKNISIYQASNDLADIEAKFRERFNTEEDELKFLNLMTEELTAYAQATNDEAARINQKTLETEVTNQYVGEMIGGIIGVIVFCFLLFVIFK